MDNERISALNLSLPEWADDVIDDIDTEYDKVTATYYNVHYNLLEIAIVVQLDNCYSHKELTVFKSLNDLNAYNKNIKNNSLPNVLITSYRLQSIQSNGVVYCTNFVSVPSEIAIYEQK